MLLVPTLATSSTHTDDTAPFAPDDIAINGRSSVVCNNDEFVPKRDIQMFEELEMPGMDEIIIDGGKQLLTDLSIPPVNDVTMPE